MAYELKDGQGSLFKNDKGDNAKRPDYRGSVKIGGVEYELAAWIREGQKGKYMSLSAKPKGERPMPKRDDDPVPQDPNDDIPF